MILEKDDGVVVPVEMPPPHELTAESSDLDGAAASEPSSTSASAPETAEKGN